VALMVIVCGALLVVGGAISLLMGFDIVMTERGSAMTLGGIIALSGGVITVGIGFALLRLSQILAALQERNVRGARPVVTAERPVVPLIPPEPVASGEKPLPPVTEPGVNRIGLGAGAVTASIVASAAGFAASKAGAERHEAEVVPAHEPHASAAVHRDMPDKPEQPYLDTALVVAASPPSPGSIPDLEEELARALAEPEAVPSTVPARDQSFANGLSDLLAKPRGRKRNQEPDLVADPELEVGSEQEAEFEAPSGPETDQKPDSVEASLPEPVEVMRAVSAGLHERIVSLDLPGASGAVHETAPVDTDADALQVSETDRPQTTSPVDKLVEDDLMVEPPSAPVMPSKKVLGTYNAGGRTYSMYADGSVEALTEFGVERFSSMDELRRHLVRA
jgi:hypothetical protein